MIAITNIRNGPSDVANSHQVTRQCRKCQAQFSGIRCKECVKRKNREYAAKNPEKIKAQRAKFYAENPEKVAAYNFAWRAKNQERFEAAQRKWRDENKQKVREKTARYKERLPDAYVASLLGLPLERCPKELIELKRVHVEIKRQIREAQ